MGRPHEAVPYLKEAVSQTTRTGGAHGPDHGRHLSNLGYSYALMGQFPEPHEHLSQAVEMLTATLGAEYPETLQPGELLERIKVTSRTHG